MFNIHFTQTSIDHSVRIMEKLTQLPCAKPFLLPVDPVRDGVPNYYHVITQPIDISLIIEKLLLMKYSFIHEWIRDVFLIRDNAKTFNGTNSFIYLLSRRLIEHFERELKEFYIYNTKLWSKRYQEISKKLQDQMRQVPPVLLGQGQNSARADQLLSQNVGSLIISENQPRRPISIQSNNNTNFNPRSFKGPSMQSRLESTNELISNDRKDIIQPISVHRPEEPQLNSQQSAESIKHDESDNFHGDLEIHDTDFSHFNNNSSHQSSIFQRTSQHKSSIFNFDRPQNTRSGSIFGDIDPLSLPPALPTGDTTYTQLPKNKSTKSSSSTTNLTSPKSSTNFTPKPTHSLPNRSRNSHQIPQSTTHHPIFPQQQFQQHPQQLNGGYRTNYYGMVNSLISDPSTISPPEIGPIINSKPNFNSEGDSISSIPYIPESTMNTSLTSTSAMNNTEMSPSFSSSFTFVNSSQSPDHLNEQKKLFIMRYVSLFNNFSDMLTLHKIISMREPHFSHANNEIDLALLNSSTINELFNFMRQRLNTSKARNNATLNNPVSNNLDY